jgi:hypothetical protein
MIRTALLASAVSLSSVGMLAAQTPPASCGCDPLVIMIEEGARADVICPDPTTRAALLDLWSGTRPEGATRLVIRKSTGRADWASDATTLDALIAEAGGTSGFTGPPAERAACFGVGGICANPQRNALGGIQPRDGLWRAELGDISINGCPEAMAAAVLQAMPADIAETSVRRSFPDPFHPDALGMSPEGAGAWQERPDGSWQIDLAPPIDQAPGASTEVRIGITPVCDTEIAGQTEIAVKLPQVAQAMLGVAPEGCFIRRPFTLRRVGE